MHSPFDDIPRPHPGEAASRQPAQAVPDPEEVEPAVLGALLARHGWQRRGGAPGRYSRWTPPGAAEGTSLLVPESSAFPDCGDLLAEALTGLARSASPSARSILAGLSEPGDELQLSREVPDAVGPRGATAWPVQEQLRSGARAMLLAGALTVHKRAAYHGARHRRQAEAALRQVRVGPVTDGSRLTAHLPLERGRTVAAALLRAVHAARDATDYRRATGGMEAFDAAVELGVCRELTSALVGLVRGSEGIRIALEWAPAGGPPAGFPARPEPVEFSPGDLPALREAGERLVRDEPSVLVRITGTVLRMRRSEPAGPGTVRLRVLAGADVAQVRVALDEDAYRVAGHAHLEGLPIRVSGRLESRSGFRRVTGAGEVAPVPVDTSERDRMMKSLHEQLDFFEEAERGEG